VQGRSCCCLRRRRRRRARFCFAAVRPNLCERHVPAGQIYGYGIHGSLLLTGSCSTLHLYNNWGVSCQRRRRHRVAPVCPSHK
jgi:hypothetical protein